MKKIFLVLSAASLLLAGCAKESLTEKVGEGNQLITFNVGLDATTTKAAADGDGAGAKVNHWVMEILDSDGERYSYKEDDATAGQLTHSFTVSLVKGQTYDILFWADTKGNYDVTKLTDVKLTDQTAYTANSDARDAFSAVVADFTSIQASSQAVTLTRPFGQLNVIFTDLNKLYATIGNDTEYAKFKPTTFELTAKLPTSFNVLTQAAGAPATTALTISAAENYLNNYTAHADKATLFMDYFFATKDNKDVVDLDFSFASKGITISHEFNSVPFQRNYRTNIMGELMSNNAKWNVEVSAIWDSPEDTVIVASTLAEAQSIVSSSASSVTVKVAQEAAENATESDVKEDSGKNYLQFVLKTTSPESVNFILPSVPSTVGSKTIEGWLVSYEDGYPTENVGINATADTKIKIVAPNSHVVVSGTTYTEIVAKTGDNTLVIPEGVSVSKLIIEKGNINLLGSATSIERSADNLDAKTYIFMYPSGIWTNLESETSATLVPAYQMVTNGTKSYFFLSEALADITDGGELKIHGNISETPSRAVELLTSGDLTITADSPVVATVSPLSKVSSVDNDGMAYFRSTGEKPVITIGENVTLRFPADAQGAGAMYLGYSSTTPVDFVVNGKIEAYLPYIGAQSSMTVNPSGSLTSVSENLIVRWGATLDVDGTDGSWTEANPQVNLAYASQQGGVVTFKNTFVNAGAWWNMWNRNNKTDVDTKLILDNTVFKANGFTGSTSTVPTYSVELKNNSQMKVNGGFSVINGGTVSIESGSFIEAKSVSNAGVINIDATSATADSILVISCSGSADYGTVNVQGNYKAVVEGNNLFIIQYAFMIGEQGYSTFAEAVSAAEIGHTINIVKAGEYTLPNLPKNITIKGKDGVRINARGTGSICSVPNGVTFESLEFELGSSNYHGFQHPGKIIFNECSIDGLLFAYGNIDFNNTTFTNESDYCMWTYGAAEINYTGCVFNTYKGKAINVYCESTDNVPCVYSFTDCDFNNLTHKMSAEVDQCKPGLAIKNNGNGTSSTKPSSYDIRINNCTFDGFGQSDGDLMGFPTEEPYVNAYGYNSATAPLKVTVDGVVTVDIK